jgi:hypothetical protein
MCCPDFWELPLSSSLGKRDAVWLGGDGAVQCTLGAA